MYDAVTNNLLIREWLNGSLFPLCGNLALILLIFLVDSYRYREGKSWWRVDGVPTGCALFWVFSMETVRAGWIWWILRETNDGYPVEEWVREVSNYSFVIAASVLALTILRCTYLWSPPKWQKFFWRYSAISTVIFLIISHSYPHTGN